MQVIRIIVATLLCMVSIVSVCGGIFVIYLARKHQLLKRTIWLLLISLTLSDTATTFITTPTFIAACFDQSVLNVGWVCDLNASSTRFFACTSIYAMTAISILKCIIVYKPFISLDGDSWKIFVVYSGTVVLVSTCLSLCPVLGYGEYNHVPGSLWCCYRSTSPEKIKENKHLMVLIQVLGYLAPSCVIIGASIVTFVSFHKSGAFRKRIRRMSTLEVYVQNQAMVKLLLTFVIAFMICWTPFFLYCLIGCLGVKQPLVIGDISYILMFARGVINPSIYCFRHNIFKEEFRKMFNTIRCRENDTKEIHQCAFIITANESEGRINFPMARIVGASPVESVRFSSAHRICNEQDSKDTKTSLPPDPEEQQKLEYVDSDISDLISDWEYSTLRLKATKSFENSRSNWLCPTSKNDVSRSLSVPISVTCQSVWDESNHGVDGNVEKHVEGNINKKRSKTKNTQTRDPSVDMEYNTRNNHRGTTETIVSDLDQLNQIDHQSSVKRLLRTSRSAEASSDENYWMTVRCTPRELIQRTASVPLSIICPKVWNSMPKQGEMGEYEENLDER